MQAALLLFVVFILPFGTMIFGFSKISSLIKHKTGLSSLKSSNNNFDFNTFEENHSNDSTDESESDILMDDEDSGIRSN